ncbi:hypothetical protein KSP35_03090 [Aquihabitans sp. G128]|uniref:hypothetical protein n=1 Tax=Aquihabitans sp. G128 TaxID=2849779 RepID=UPI001C247E8D|nr:hypothetical protein [Aquihabitans sp. G128]QXC61835.1 hypothetical protein KSP35_03090 [Aquihabitans sp. G128]
MIEHRGGGFQDGAGREPSEPWRGPDRHGFAVAAVVLGATATLAAIGVVALAYGWFGRDVEDPGEGYELYGAFLVLVAALFSAVVGAIGFGLALAALFGADHRRRTRRLGSVGLGLSLVPFVAVGVGLAALVVAGTSSGG